MPHGQVHADRVIEIFILTLFPSQEDEGYRKGLRFQGWLGIHIVVHKDHFEILYTLLGEVPQAPLEEFASIVISDHYRDLRHDFLSVVF